jgi:hypothetical protein
MSAATLIDGAKRAIAGGAAKTITRTYGASSGKFPCVRGKRTIPPGQAACTIVVDAIEIGLPVGLILVRNWCGPRLAIEILSAHIWSMELGNRRLEDLGLHEVRNEVAP